MSSNNARRLVLALGALLLFLLFVVESRRADRLGEDSVKLASDLAECQGLVLKRTSEARVEPEKKRQACEVQLLMAQDQTASCIKERIDVLKYTMKNCKCASTPADLAKEKR